jgi:hypothetical protein
MLRLAGNNGTNTRNIQTTGTVTSPATCKNVMAVGATESIWSEVVDVVSLLDKDSKQVRCQVQNPQRAAPHCSINHQCMQGLAAGAPSHDSSVQGTAS